MYNNITKLNLFIRYVNNSVNAPTYLNSPPHPFMLVACLITRIMQCCHLAEKIKALYPGRMTSSKGVKIPRGDHYCTNCATNRAKGDSEPFRIPNYSHCLSCLDPTSNLNKLEFFYFFFMGKWMTPQTLNHIKWQLSASRFDKRLFSSFLLHIGIFTSFFFVLIKRWSIYLALFRRKRKKNSLNSILSAFEPQLLC